MSIEWYIGFDGQVVGPVDEQQLLDFLKSSEQWRQILVWHSGLDEWKLAKDVPDIAALVSASKGPPPLPPPPAPSPKAEAPSIVPAAPAIEAKPAEPAPPSEIAKLAEPVVTAAPPIIVSAEPAIAPVAAPMPAPAAERIEVLAAQTTTAPAAPPAKRRWGWGATALTILVLIGGGLVATQVKFKDSATVAKATQPSNEAVIERGFAEVVQATTLPRKLDDYTTRLDVTQAGKRLVFHHIIDTTRYLVPQNFAAATKEKMLSEACSTSVREALKAGGTLEYRFHTQAAFLIGSFEIGGNDCGGNGQPKG